MDMLHDIINFINAPLWDVVGVILLAVGVYFTLTTGFVQIRLFSRSIKEMLKSNTGKKKNITPFQAFVTGLASRVGVGNIAGVAIAIVTGGPGAVFWMWVTALIGMSSAFAESSLAQLFKIKDLKGHFRGGPAYYIQQGLKQNWFAWAFAISLILTYGFVFNAVQSNTIAEVANMAWGWSPSILGAGLVILVAPLIFGGIRRISRIASVVVPIMALLYLLMAIYIMLKNYSLVPEMLKLIISSAFDFSAIAGGFFGVMISQGMMQGIKRGLYSNEAGMGSAPNAAAAAETKHPVNQGMVQMLGVFVDTILVCTATAVIILLSGLHETSGQTGAQLTQLAIEAQVGSWGKYFLAVVIFLFAFSSIIGNYAYAESNVLFIKNNRTLMTVFRMIVLAMVFFGAVQKVSLVWDSADTFMGIMALINLIAIVLLSPLVWTLLKDYQQQLKYKTEPEFDISLYPKLSKRVKGSVWQKSSSSKKTCSRNNE